MCIRDRCSEEKLLAEFSVNTGLTHSQTMMPMAQAALDCAKLTLHDIDAFAVAAGPGSFTGLRIGICLLYTSPWSGHRG